MNLFNYLIAKKGHNTSVRDDLFAYLLGKRTPKEVKTATGTTVSITDATREKIVSLTLDKESNQDGTPTPENPVEIKTVKGYRNLFDKNSNNYFYTYIGQSTGRINPAENPAGNFRTIFIPCEPNKKYYIDKKVGTSLLYMGTLNEEPQLGAYLNDYKFISSSKYALSTSNNAKYLVVEICSNTDINNGFTIEEIIDNFQIVEGTEELPYVPYGTNWIYTAVSNGTDTNYYTIPLNDNEIAGIGDYKDELIVDKNGHCWLNKKIGKKIFNDSDTFVGQYSTSSRTGFWTLIKDIKPISSANETPNLLSTKFISVSMNTTWKPGNMSMVPYEGNLNKVYFFLEANKTVNDIKNVLVNQPIYYPLATPQLIDINYTVDIELFKGINNISNSDDMDMTLKYY